MLSDLEDAKIVLPNLNKFLFDLNTPEILRVLFAEADFFGTFSKAYFDDLSLIGKEGESSATLSYHLGKARTALDQTKLISQLLGLLQKDPEDWFKGGASAEDEAEFDAIAMRREQARAQKDWAAADAARDEATAKGIVLEDGPDGTTWRKA